jgi:hypothetical protein
MPRKQNGLRETSAKPWHQHLRLNRNRANRLTRRISSERNMVSTRWQSVADKVGLAPKEDPRLDRLLDYTKFHIGIYLSVGGALVGLIGLASKTNEMQFLQKLVGQHHVGLAVALALMVVAGLAGGIIASGCTQCTTFEQVWAERHGPHKLTLLTGQTWAFIEHVCFWLSLLSFALTVLIAPGVSSWLFT